MSSPSHFPTRALLIDDFRGRFNEFAMVRVSTDEGWQIYYIVNKSPEEITGDMFLFMPVTEPSLPFASMTGRVGRLKD